MTFRAIPFNPLPSAGAFVAPSLRLMRFLARDRAFQKIPGEMSARAGAAQEAWRLLFFFNEFWAHTPTHMPQIGILALSIGKKKMFKSSPQGFRHYFT